MGYVNIKTKWWIPERNVTLLKHIKRFVLGTHKMELLVNYKILATGPVGQERICVSEWECKKVLDIKQTLQEVLHAPMCDQQIFYQGRLLDNNLTPLKNLYIRQGDILEVHFVCMADLNEIQELLHDLKQFRMRISTNQDSLLKITPEHFANDSFPVDYTDVTHALELLAFRFFAPWKTIRSLTNRRLFVQEGGFDVFTDIFKFSFKRYSSGERVEEVNVQGETEEDKRQLDRQDILDLPMLRFLNAEQINLLVSCLTFLWNFSETKQDRKLIIKKGMFQLATDALLFDPDMQHDFDPVNELRDMVIEVNEQAIGCVAGCVEFDSDAQEAVVNNVQAIRKVIAMMNIDRAKVGRFSLFCSQLASNALFYCTFNLKTHSLFVEQGYLQDVIIICTRYIKDPSGDMVLRYYCCLVLARISSSLAVPLETEILKVIDGLIDNFLNKTDPGALLEWEKRHFYVWMTLVPFVQLAFARGPQRQETTSGSKTSQFGLGHSSKRRKSTGQTELEMKVDFFSCESWMAGETSCFDDNERCGSAVEQDVISDGPEESSSTFAVDNLHSASVTEDNTSVKGEQYMLTKASGKNSAQGNVTITDNETRHEQETKLYPGSRSVGRLGLFALSYLMRVEENRQLIKSERMVGYLVCLTWYLPTEERNQLRENLKGFLDSKSAPSLKIIAGSVLARIHGLSAALEM